MSVSEKLNTRQTAKYKTVNGVTYFKLKSEFDGDYTKNCGLLGEEIDQNFYFLRGFDIASIEMDGDRRLVIKRVDEDYEPIIVNLAEEIGQPKFSDVDTDGFVTVTYPDGSTEKFGGFLVEGQDVRMATDDSIKGNGTIYKPLGISEIAKTGTYAPADEYFDISDTNVMPEGKGKGYRIVTKETINYFGRLYPYSAVEKISAKLEEMGSQWRVPSKQDWDELLNALEPCEDKRNHNEIYRDLLGEQAGKAMKSVNLWDEFEGDDVKGQDIVGLAVYPLGECSPLARITKSEDRAEARGYGEFASFWTTTPSQTMGYYTKSFTYDKATVLQDVANANSKHSIRLVKDYAYSNFNNIESILGIPYPCTLVYSPFDDNYAKIWTSINIGIEDQELGGVVSDEWAAATENENGEKKVYFINEWTGTEWVKKVMGEGDSVVIKDYNGNAPYHEWRIINEELIDTVDAIMNEFSDELNNINGKINALESRQDLDERRLDAVEPRVDALEGRQNVDEQRLDALEDRQDTDEQRLDALEDRQNTDESRFGALESRQNVDEQRLDALESRQNADESRFDALESRQNVDEQRLDALEGRQDTDEQRLDALEGRQNVDESRLVTVESHIESLESRQNVDEQRLDALEGRQDTDEQRLDALEGRQDTDEQRLDAVETHVNTVEGNLVTEIKERIANDITPGEYEIMANESVTIPTNGEDVADLSIKIADNFFDFGSF